MSKHTIFLQEQFKSQGTVSPPLTQLKGGR